MKLHFFFIVAQILFIPCHSQEISDSIAGFRYRAYIPSGLKPGEKFPAIFLLHGYGSNEQDLFAFHQTLPSGYAFISIRAPFSLSGKGYAWYELTMKNGSMTHNYSQARKVTMQLNIFIRTLQKKYSLDTLRTVLMGYSQGGILTWLMVISNPVVPGAVILSAYIPDDFHELLPEQNTSKNNKKIFVAHGYSDNVIPFAWHEATMKFIKKFSFLQTEVHHYEMPHAITGKELVDIRNFLSRNFKP